MKRGTIIVLFLLLPSILFAQQALNDIPNRYHAVAVHMPDTAPEGVAPELPDVQMQQSTGKKSMLKGILFSLIMPGAGQWYTGGKLKAAGFAAAEVAFWFGISHFNDEGDRIDAEFRAFADQHWRESEYRVWYDNLDPERKSILSHSLPDTKTQQYYEMIGKYDQFLAGWPDYDGEDSVMRRSYMARQADSNDEYKKAEMMANMMVLNRVISAAEAALSIHRRNSRIQPGLSIRPAPGTYRLVPEMYVTINW